MAEFGVHDPENPETVVDGAYLTLCDAVGAIVPSWQATTDGELIVDRSDGEQPPPD